jgi:hypothetical protein
VDLDEAMKEGSDTEDEVIRVSGNHCPEFPEPTDDTPAPPPPVAAASGGTACA